MMPDVIQRSWRHLRRVFARSPWASELWSSITVISWGAAVISAPPEVAEWPPISYLVQAMPYQYWGTKAIILGGLQFTALVTDARWCRWVMSLIMAYFWTILTLAVVASVPWLPGVAVYAGWAGINLFSVFRLLRPDR